MLRKYNSCGILGRQATKFLFFKVTSENYYLRIRNSTISIGSNVGFKQFLSKFHDPPTLLGNIDGKSYWLCNLPKFEQHVRPRKEPRTNLVRLATITQGVYMSDIGRTAQSIKQELVAKGKW